MGALIHFNQYNYIFPKFNFNLLISHVMTADILGADDFMEYVGEKLCLPTTRFNLSNSSDAIFKAVRDRYRLSRKVQLGYPPQDLCYSCKGTLNSATYTVECCGMEFHSRCLKTCKKCPYCHTPWVSLKCVVCRFSCMPQKQQSLYRSYSARMKSRMTCCSADIHDECKRKVVNKCPACETEFINGFPISPKSPKEFCNKRWILRQTQLQRRELATMR